MTATAATAADGRRVRFLHNWCWEPTSVRAPVALSDVLGTARFAVGDEVRLGAWDVRVLTED
jgi:beta-galactosidase